MNFWTSPEVRRKAALTSLAIMNAIGLAGCNHLFKPSPKVSSEELNDRMGAIEERPLIVMGAQIVHFVEGQGRHETGDSIKVSDPLDGVREVTIKLTRGQHTYEILAGLKEVEATLDPQSTMDIFAMDDHPVSKHAAARDSDGVALGRAGGWVAGINNIRVYGQRNSLFRRHFAMPYDFEIHHAPTIDPMYSASEAKTILQKTKQAVDAEQEIITAATGINPHSVERQALG